MTISNADKELVENVTETVLSMGEFSGEPDMSILQGETLQPPMFESACMGNAASWINATAEAANVYPDYVASILLGAASGVIGKVYSVNVNDNDWKSPCCVWCFSLGDSGSGKTPACGAVRAALDAVEALYRERHENDVDFDIRAKEAELVQIRDKAKVHRLEAELDALKELRDMPPRAVVIDATKEAVAHVSNRSPRGLLLDDDELAGWLGAGMEGYGGGSARPMYLKAWNGETARIDRRGKGGTIVIDKFLLAVHGGIQPDRLTSLLLRNQDDDGLATRALLFWPRVRPAISLRGRPQANPQSVIRAMLRLAELQSGQDGPNLLTWHEDNTAPEHCAFSAIDDYNMLINERLERTPSGMYKSALAKMFAHVTRLAGLLHLIDWAFGGSDTPSRVISAETARNAIKLVEEYFVPQARRVYHGLDVSAADRMASDILHIAKQTDTRTIRTGEILRTMKPKGYRAERGAERPEQIRDAAMLLLEQAGWVMVDTTQTKKKSAKFYRFNPILFEEKIAA